MNIFISSTLCFLLFLPGTVFGEQRPIEPLPLTVEYDKNKAEIGKSLFFDPALSGDGTISCASCHQADHGGADNVRFSLGVKDVVGNINTPTVFNSRFNIAQFWNGRAADLQEQAKGPITNPKEMNSSFPKIIAYINESSDLKKTMIQEYGAINEASITHALAEFEKTLVTVNSRFDRFLRGEESAITPEEKEGYRLFVDYGCISCHNGKNVGGNMFQKFGVFNSKTINDEMNLGRYDVTKKEHDRYVFKVPSLRTASETPPYFHTGTVMTLEEAVRIMGVYQLGHKIEDKEVKLLVKFLRSLKGENPFE